MKRVSAAVVLLTLLGVAACGDDEPALTVVEVPEWAKVAPEQIAEAKKHGVPVAFENELGMRFVLIPAGTFLLGGAEVKWPDYPIMNPQHEVTLTKPYYMQITEVTNAQYRRFVPEYVCSDEQGFALDGPEQPVCAVTWHEAAAFSEWARARLPTEREWEVAARGGLVGRRKPWGDDWDATRANCRGAADGYDQSAPVGSFPPNGYGLYDMAGNVGEWCQDRLVPWLGDGTVNTPEDIERWRRIEAAEARIPQPVPRGGSWKQGSTDIADRWEFDEHGRVFGIGFRLVSPLPESSK